MQAHPISRRHDDPKRGDGPNAELPSREGKLCSAKAGDEEVARLVWHGWSGNHQNQAVGDVDEW